MVVHEIRVRSPSLSMSTKAKRGDKLFVSVIVRSDEEPSALIVEAWGALKESSTQQIAYPLSYKSSQDGWHHYTAHIELEETGYFNLAFRARSTEQNHWVWVDDKGHHTTANIWVDPEWTRDSIVYNAFVRYFGAKSMKEDGSLQPGDGGTFDDVKKELDKLKDMGINVLYMNPVHPIGELFKNYNPHDLLPAYLQPGCPYSIKDYKNIDPELSFKKTSVDNEEHPFSEFRKLVEYAHSLGIRVFMDLVFNHSAHDSVFQRLHPEWYLYKEDIWSLEAPYLYPEDVAKGKPWGDSKHTFSPNDHGYWWNDAAQLNWNNCDQYPEYIMKNISANKPPKNPTIKEMYEYFKNIVKFWIKEFGIDGFRCDVAYRVPLDFWKECIIEARATAKETASTNGSVDGDVVFIAESYYVMMPQLLDAGFMACYGDFSNKLTSTPHIAGYLDYMYNISGKHFPQGTDWFIFPECHDFHRNPTKVAEQFKDQHVDADLHANKSRWTLTAMLPGMPMIFNGFEKIEWQPASLFSYSAVDWESDKDISEHIQKINLIRRNEKTLQDGRYYFLQTNEGVTEQAKIFSFARLHKNECIIVAINLDLVHKFGTEIHLTKDLPIDYSKEYELHDLYTDKTYKQEGNKITVILGPGDAHIFKVQQ